MSAFVKISPTVNLACAILAGFVGGYAVLDGRWLLAALTFIEAVSFLALRRGTLSAAS